MNLDERMQTLALHLDTHAQTSISFLNADPWVISSLLQKSIRRGDADLAEAAALTLLRQRGSDVWRRLLLIAFEDVGVGSIDALLMTGFAGDASLRRSLGPNDAVVRAIARRLATATKDRSGDYLICGAVDQPSLAAERQAMADRSIEDVVSLLAYEGRSLPIRAIAALEIVSRRAEQGGVSELLSAYRELGVPRELVETTRVAHARTREPITLMVPLLWLAARPQEASIVRCAVPETLVVGGIPLYALDKHTRVGRDAIGRFARENPVVRDCLGRHAGKERGREAALMAAFYTDASPIAQRFDWRLSRELEEFGRESDMLVAGVTKEGIAPLLAAFTEQLADLNRIRREVFERSRRALSPLGGEGAS
jgi:hypothetical protein